MLPPVPFPEHGKTALVVAHPGHELRVHGLVSRLRPLVFILTDGSGRTGRSRLPASLELLAQAGARPGEIFGLFSDHELYEALLARDASPFIEIVERLRDSFVHSGLERVLGDACEGYNPAHDVCRLLIDAAVTQARAAGATIGSFAFSLVGPPDGGALHASSVERIPLSPEEFASKLQAANRYEGLDDEVRRALAVDGAEAFRTEWIWEVDPATSGKPFSGALPYETFGEERVKSRFYREVIRYDTHIRPLAEALAAMSRSTA
ncbi:MAG: hypothetical protein ABIT01_10800 [Thermoanaerobaculia bacterium]